MRKTYSEEQLNILREYYPSGDWEHILPLFPGKTKGGIGAIARANGIYREKQLIRDLDITGNTYGMLTAVSKVDEGGRVVFWKCKCQCGSETVVPIYSLLKNQIKSCGCLKHQEARNAKDFSGTRFGLFTAVEKLPRYKNGETYYRCICDCGAEKLVKSCNLKSGHTRSCGGKIHTKKEFQVLNYELDKVERTYYIYRHISPSGKSYIGITKQNPERRFQNGSGYSTQKAFYRAIKKYGWDSFKHEILEEGLTEEEAYEKEAYYISEVYQSFAPNGYNTREGGIHARHFIIPVVQYYNDEPVNYFEGMNQAAKTLGIAAATIKLHVGRENAIAGYYFEILPSTLPYNVNLDLQELENKEHYCIKDIIDSVWKQKTVARNIETSKPVNKYSLDGKYICTFSSVSEAKETITDSGGWAIYAAVNSKRQGETAYGFMWKYDEGNHSDIQPVKYKSQKAVEKINKESGAVIEEYKSISSAAKDLKVSMNKIKYACNGKDSFETFTLRYK